MHRKVQRLCGSPSPILVIHFARQVELIQPGFLEVAEHFPLTRRLTVSQVLPCTYHAVKELDSQLTEQGQTSGFGKCDKGVY